MGGYSIVSSNHQPLIMGVAGMGGFAAAVTNLVLSKGPEASPAVELAAVCDPAPDSHGDRASELRGRGVAIYDSYEALLAHPGIEAVWLPVPIDLHRPFTEQALAAGKAVMVEKPVAGSVDDLDAMIAARDQAGLPVAVGFQDIYDPANLTLKRRVLGGEFGAIRQATLTACWPRNGIYFGRCDWAGRYKRNGVWVMDSPANNALAHFINLALFLLGPSEWESVQPQHVEAELYRAAPIENYDTIAMRLTVEGGASLLVFLTHACADTHHPVLLLEGASGQVVWTTDCKAAAARLGAGVEVTTASEGRHGNMVQRFARLVRGIEDHDATIATLESARCHTIVVNGASAATPVYPVPAEATVEAPLNGGTVRAIRGIEDVFFKCADRRMMLHESGLLPFTQAPGSLDLRGYDHFAGPCCADGQPAAGRA